MPRSRAAPLTMHRRAGQRVGTARHADRTHLAPLRSRSLDNMALPSVGQPPPLSLRLRQCLAHPVSTSETVSQRHETLAFNQDGSGRRLHGLKLDQSETQFGRLFT